MKIIDAATILDLQVNTPQVIDQRSTICSSDLSHFDSIAGLLQFFTACAGSRNSYIQTVLFEDWASLGMPAEPVEPELPIEPQDQSEPADLHAQGQLEEEPELRGDEDWQTVLSRFPEIVNMDVKVHCNCPHFQYWGPWYNLEVRDTSLFPEGIGQPTMRDPYEQNIICKHLAAVFRQYF